MQQIEDALRVQRLAVAAIMQEALACWRVPTSIDQLRDFVGLVMCMGQEAFAAEGVRIPVLKIKTEIRNAVEEKLTHSDAAAAEIKACLECVNLLWIECDANKAGRQQLASSSSAMWSDIDYIVEYLIQKQKGSKSCGSPVLKSVEGEGATAAALDDDDDLDGKPFEVSGRQFSLRMQNWWLKRVKTGRFRMGDTLTYKSSKCSITAKYELQDHASSGIFRDPITWALNGREKTLKMPALAGTMRSIFHEDDRHGTNSMHRVLSLACARNLRTAMQFLSGEGGTGKGLKRRALIGSRDASRDELGNATGTKARDVGDMPCSARQKLPRLCSQDCNAGGSGRATTPPTPPPEKHLVITIRSESMKKSEDVQLRIKRYKPISKYLDHYNSLYPVTADQARVFYAGPKVIMPEETADEQQLTGANVLQAHVISGLGRKW